MHAEVLAKKGFVLYLKDNLRANNTEIFDDGNITVHLYISSAPCGNAVIKKWAKPTLGPNHNDVLGIKWPPPSEQNFYFTAKHEGQGCLLVKGSTMTKEDQKKSRLKFEIPNATQLWSMPPSSPRDSQSKTKGVDCSGCHEAVMKRSLTCSDKILFWQHLGVQGSKLLNSGYVTKPIRLSTITVGRKFSEPHLRRAFFGRYQPTKNTTIS